MPKKQPTIYDVAQLAGCSISTVSRVLNVPDKVNGETRGQVLAAIQELSYVPKAEARARAMKETHRIGVLAPLFTSQSFVPRLRGVAAALAGSNVELVAYNVDSRAHLNSLLDTIPLLHNLDGLIIMSLRIDETYAQRLIDQGLETVLIEYPTTALSCVEIDDIGGGKMAGEYLIFRGYRKPAFVGGFDDPEFGIHPIGRRLEGFLQALKACDIPFPPQYNQSAPFDIQATREKCKELLTLPDRPDAIFAATDLQAMGVLKACQDLSLRVPEDVAVLGFDDLDFSEYIGLSTVRQPLDESGRVAVELLTSRISDPQRPHRIVRLPLSIVSRETA